MESNEIDLDSISDSDSKAEKLLERYKTALICALVGLVLLGSGIFYIKNGNPFSASKVEIIESDKATLNPTSDIIVEVAGSIEKPGVYKMKFDARVNDLLIECGGLRADADKEWFEKTVNKAAKLTDGQKLYIPAINEQSNVLSANSQSTGQTGQSGDIAEKSGLVNINTASISELDTLPGIGPVYGQNIIEHRPYSSVEELLSKGALKKNVYEKIKEKVTVF